MDTTRLRVFQVFMQHLTGTTMHLTCGAKVKQGKTECQQYWFNFELHHSENGITMLFIPLQLVRITNQHLTAMSHRKRFTMS
jgi:hypothetical protein